MMYKKLYLVSDNVHKNVPNLPLFSNTDLVEKPPSMNLECYIKFFLLGQREISSYNGGIFIILMVL